MMPPLKLAVISHSCVLPANQRVWAEVVASPEVDLTLIAPTRWQSSLHGMVAFTALPALAERARSLPVRRSGSLHLHVYPDLATTLDDLQPAVLYLDEDPHSLVARQVLAAQRRLGFRLIITLKQNVPKRYPPPFGAIERRAFRMAAAAAATSAECLQVARAKGFARRAELVYYPVDVELFRPADDRPRDPAAPFRLGYAGRLVPEKGLAEVVRALALVRQPVELVIVGSGPQEQQLRRLASATGATVRFEPRRAPEQMPEWYRSLEAFVLASRTTPRWKEQFGRAAAEALACGIPVIGSASGFIPELLELAGGGLVFAEGDVTALAAAIDRLAGDAELRRELGERGRERVTSLFSHRAIAARLLNLIITGA